MYTHAKVTKSATPMHNGETFEIVRYNKIADNYLLQVGNRYYRWFHSSEIVLLNLQENTEPTPAPTGVTVTIDGKEVELLQFNLDEALADPSRVVTREGQGISYIHLAPLDILYPLLVIGEGDDEGSQFTKQGKYYEDDTESSELDLFLLPKQPVEKVMYSLIHIDNLFSDLDDAKRLYNEAFNHLIKLIYHDNILVNTEIVK